METDFIAAAGKICEQDVLAAARGCNFQRSLRKWVYTLRNALIPLFVRARIKNIESATDDVKEAVVGCLHCISLLLHSFVLS